MPEYVLVFLYKQNSENALSLKSAKNLNVAKFWESQGYLNMKVLHSIMNMPWQSSE